MTTFPRGRLAARLAQYVVTTSTLAFDIANRDELMHDMLEIYRRGVAGEPRPPCCPPPFDVENNWMRDYPTAYVIPLGATQRSDPEANRLVRWMLTNGIEVSRLEKDAVLGSQTFPAGSYVVWMDQPHRGLAETALGIGDDVSSRISVLYAPPGAWSHGYLWGASVVTVPQGASFQAKTKAVSAPQVLGGGVVGTGDSYALAVDSPTAVRTLNQLVANGVAAQLALASFTSGGATYPAGSAVFPANAATTAALDAAGRANGIVFRGVTAASLPALDPVDRVPRIAVLTGALNQDIWVLRNLGFTADPIATGGTSALNNPSAPDPLAGYDVVFNTAGWPAGTTARARLTAFFASHGGYIGAGANGAAFLTSAAQVAGLTAASRGGNGRSGIVYWDNLGGASSPVVGTYPAQDTAIMDPPTWFTSTGPLSVDARFPNSGFFAAGLWLLDAQSATAPGSAVIAHGTNTSGSARVTVYAMNPLYRADPEREWPSISTAAYWSDQ